MDAYSDPKTQIPAFPRALCTSLILTSNLTYDPELTTNTNSMGSNGQYGAPNRH